MARHSASSSVARSHRVEQRTGRDSRRGPGKRRSKGRPSGGSGRGITKERLAYESARIISDDGLADFERARRKAAQRLGVADRRCWPDNSEIEAALLRQVQLFHADAAQHSLETVRSQALAAMRSLAEFEPRLVVPAASGAPTPQRGIVLLLFAEDPIHVAFALIDRNIPWRERDQQFRYSGGGAQSHPVFAFEAGGVSVELIALPVRARHNPPLNPVSERPERGMSTEELERLMAAHTPDA